MHPLRRPSTVLALVLAAVGGTGCPIWGCSGDMSFEDRERSGAFSLEDDGTVLTWDGTVVDPTTAEGCEHLCAELEHGYVTEVSSCEAVMPEDEDLESLDTGDTGEAGLQVDITCVASGQDYCVGGRHTGTLATRAHGHGVDPAAAWLAREACGEAGSVHAFRQLARELTAHGAPRALVDAARAAMSDEVQHARMVRELARAHGGRPDPARAIPQPPRDLFTVALENAVEGCVHETFAAARAGHQALHAEDAAVRRVSAVLAEDEARHADLAAAVHAWALAVLPPKQAAAVEEARQTAWARLAAHPPVMHPDAVRILGLPDADVHRRLAEALAGALVARAA
jgi:rubrerythrin